MRHLHVRASGFFAKLNVRTYSLTVNNLLRGQLSTITIRFYTGLSSWCQRWRRDTSSFHQDSENSVRTTTSGAETLLSGRALERFEPKLSAKNTGSGSHRHRSFPSCCGGGQLTRVSARQWLRALPLGLVLPITNIASVRANFATASREYGL